MLKNGLPQNRCWAVRGIERWAVRGTKVFYGGRSEQAGMRPDGVDWGGVYTPSGGFIKESRFALYLQSPINS